MKKISVNTFLTIIVMILLAGMFVYFFLQLNRMDKKITAVNTTIVENANQISAIVNFFNSNTNAAAK